MAATPAKRSRVSSFSISTSNKDDTTAPSGSTQKGNDDPLDSSPRTGGAILVEETPAKPKQQRSSSTESLLNDPLTPLDDDDELLYATPAVNYGSNKGKRKADPQDLAQDDEDIEEDMFNDSFGSPDVLLLGSGFDSPLSPLSPLSSLKGRSKRGGSSRLGLRFGRSESPELPDTPTKIRVGKR